MYGGLSFCHRGAEGVGGEEEMEEMLYTVKEVAEKLKTNEGHESPGKEHAEPL